MKAPKKTERKIKVIKPLEVETINSSRPKEKIEVMSPIKEKIVVLTKVPVPANHIRCIVTKDHQGMISYLKTGDIVDLPERRYKTDSFRGLVKNYDGSRNPNKQR